MRSTIALLVAFVSSKAYASVTGALDACEATCASIAECANSPNYQSSYCKSWQTPQVCFGMYRRADGTFCYQPNDPTCDDLTLAPVLCSEVTAVTTASPVTTVPTETPITTTETPITSTVTLVTVTITEAVTTTEALTTTVAPETTTEVPTTTVAPVTTSAAPETSTVSATETLITATFPVV